MSDMYVFIIKVFLKYWQSDHLNAIMDDIIGRVVRAQANIRACLDRRRFLYHLRMSKQDADEVQVLSNYIDHHGDQFFQTMMTQDHHDVSRATRDRLGREVVRKLKFAELYT
jgi:hypothetical protein